MNHGTRLLSLALLGMSVSLVSTGGVAQDADVRELDGFDSISVGGGIDVTIRQGAQFRVEVEADDAEDVSTVVRAGTLHVGRTRSLFGFFNWGTAGDVRVTLPSLRSVSASGGADVMSAGTITGDSLQIRASGGADVTMNVDVGFVEVQASGGSDVRLAGSAGMANVRTNGGSDTDARDFVADSADVQSSGGSDIAITVRNAIVARASGGSDILYLGDPVSVDVASSGGGDVTHR